jgi:hypothetical protein
MIQTKKRNKPNGQYLFQESRKPTPWGEKEKTFIQQEKTTKEKTPIQSTRWLLLQV